MRAVAKYTREIARAIRAEKPTGTWSCGGVTVFDPLSVTSSAA